MGYRFSQRSLQRLETCHPVLQTLLRAAIATSSVDFTVLCGHRGKAEQDAAVAAGHSKLRWPHSKHNFSPSMAVDIAPYPIDWNDEARFISLAEEIKRAWGSMSEEERGGYDLSWGGDWVNFRDRPHWELRPRLRSR